MGSCKRPESMATPRISLPLSLTSSFQPSWMTRTPATTESYRSIISGSGRHPYRTLSPFEHRPVGRWSNLNYRAAIPDPCGRHLEVPTVVDEMHAVELSRRHPSDPSH